MKCLLIEDEPLAMSRLKDYVARVPFLQYGFEADNGLDGLSRLQREKIDLVFLDIEMDGFTGLQLLESLPNRPAVILTTAYGQHALKAFDLQVADYLLKPFTFDRFLQAANKVYSEWVEKEKISQNGAIFVKTEHRLQKLALDQILYVEGMRDYRRIHALKDKIMTLETFGELEKRLPDRQFCRVHKSYLVALDKIESVERDRITIGHQIIPLSETYKEQFYHLIGRPKI